jgi:hypothetical protein
VDLGAGRSSATLTLRDGGGAPLSWTATASAAWLHLAPAAGRLDGGGAALLGVTVDRAALPEGTATGEVAVAWSGGPARRAAVRLTVERPPALSGLSAAPDPISTRGCPQDTALAQATVRDESGVAGVVLEWGGRRVAMTRRQGAVYAARLGPVAQPGTVTWRVVATDARGNRASAAGPPVRVQQCIP